MKKHTHLIALSALFASLASNNLFAAELLVTVDNIKDIQGSLYVSVYKDDAAFNTNSNFVKREKVSVDKASIKIKLGDLPAGEYAVKAFHDVNDNGEMDFNGMLPAEPYGSSSKKSEMGPPSFSDAKFALEKDQKVKVSLLR